jgi:hypothetical protein
MDNVVDLDSVRNSKKENCEHEHVCPHCEQQLSAIDNFINRVNGLSSDSDDFRNEVETLVDFVEYYTRRDTLAEIASGIIGEINEMDGE